MASVELAKARLGVGPSRPTLYQLDLPVGNILPGADRPGVSKEVKDYLQLYAKSLSIPQVSHEVMPLLGHGEMGVMRLQPVGQKFVGNQFTIEVLENSNFSVYHDLKGLMERAGVNLNSSSSQSRSQRMRYYDSYVFDLDLSKLEFPNMGRDLKPYEKDNEAMSGYKRVAEFKFHNCYVSKIDNITLSSEAYDTATTYLVTFNYETYQYISFDKKSTRYGHHELRDND